MHGWFFEMSCLQKFFAEQTRVNSLWPKRWVDEVIVNAIDNPTPALNFVNGASQAEKEQDQSSLTV